MTRETFTGAVLGRMLEATPAALADAFERLEPDTIEYRETGFQSRHRCFSSYRFDGARAIRDDGLLPLFNARKEFHRLHSERVPSPDGDLASSGANEAFLDRLIPAFPLREPERHVFGINQVRVIADEAHLGSPAPGLHQDGYAFSCHCNLSRENVSGGASLLSTTSHPDDIFIDHALQPNEFVFFNDRRLFHTATPITQRLVGRPTWRAMIIVDVVETP